MPKWGLTRTQIEARPWGLPKEQLQPRKNVTDPVHGDVYLNELETRFADSEPLQRLRRVRQMGSTHLVYPGSTESRYSHALGTLRAAQDLLDAVIDNRNGPRPASDLFQDWSMRPDENGISHFDRNWAEVTVLARLGALLHDFCHVPFGHTVEDDLKVLVPHDRNLPRFRRLWFALPEDLRNLMQEHPDLRRELLPLVLSKDPETGKPYEIENLRYPFVADIVGNTICADLIDYLNRNHAYAGLPIGLGYRFANDFYVSRAELVDYPKRMVIRITRGGRRRVDIVTELLKYLRFRYELSERVLNHHAKLAADAMMDKLLEMWSDWLWIDRAREHRSDLVETYGTGALTRLKDEFAKLAPPEPEAFTPPELTPSEPKPTDLAELIMREVRGQLEDQFIRRSDDGILEYLRDWGDEGEAEDRRRRAIGSLAASLLNRSLFKMIGTADSASDRANSERKYTQFGTPDARRRLEEGAAECAGLDPRWHVVIWLPSPDMRLKVAEVLVDEGGKITPLDKAGFAGVRDIYENHQDLWAINIYAHPSVVSPNSSVNPDVLLAYLGEEMGVDMRRRDGSRVGSLMDLAVSELVDQHKLHGTHARRLQEIAAHHSTEAEFQPGRARSFEQIRQRARAWAEAEALLTRS